MAGRRHSTMCPRTTSTSGCTTTLLAAPSPSWKCAAASSTHPTVARPQTVHHCCTFEMKCFCGRCQRASSRPSLMATMTLQTTSFSTCSSVCVVRHRLPPRLTQHLLQSVQGQAQPAGAAQDPAPDSSASPPRSCLGAASLPLHLLLCHWHPRNGRRDQGQRGWTG